MRILLIHSFYKPGLPSGENDVVTNQADLLRSRGYEVAVWGPTSPDEMGVADQLKIGLRVATGRGQDPRPFIREFRPDLIHVHNLFPNISMQWLAQCDFPVVMSIHNYRTVCANGVLIRDSRPCTDCLTGSARSALVHGCYRDSRAATLPVLGFQRHLRSAIAADVDMLLFTSELSKEVLSPHVAHRSSLVLPNFVADIGPSPSSDPAATPPYYVVLGRLTPEKGVDRLLRMWPRHRRLIIGGDGPQRRELERQADPSMIEFRGFVEGEERNEILRSASALILPSVTLESDPVVVAQALSAGTPCVVNAQTASARLAARSPAIRAYRDAQSLEATLAGLEGDDVRDAARALYEQRWSADAWMASYEQHVLSAVGPSRLADGTES